MLRERIKAVTFDLYGTAVPYPDSSKLPRMLAWSAERLGSGITAEDFAVSLLYLNDHLDFKAEREPSFAKLRREGRRRYWDYWYACLLVFAERTSNLDDSVDGMFKLWHAHPDLILDPQLPPVLRKLREAGLRLGIISNAPELVIGKVNVEYGLRDLVDTTVLSERVGVEKPDPGIFEIAAQRLGVPWEEMMHVGDNPFTDIEPAWQLGIHPVLYDPSGKYPNTTHIRITRLGEVLEILDIER